MLTPEPRGYDADDVEIIEAIARFRAGGYDEADRLHRLRHAALPRARSSRWSREEVDVLLDRLAGEVEPERAVEIIDAGAEPLRDLIGAMHSKLLLAELERRGDRPAWLTRCRRSKNLLALGAMSSISVVASVSRATRSASSRSLVPCPSTPAAARARARVSTATG